MTKAAQTVAPLAARYGDAVIPRGVSDDAVVDLLLRHRSVRAYRPDPLPPGTLETLVAAAQSAPSSSNLQVWSVVAVEEEARKSRLAALAGNQRHIIEAPLLLIWLIDFDRLTQLGAADGIPPDALDYTESLLLGAVDASLAAQNAVVALEALGLGSVYIGGIRNQPRDVAAELNLPPRVFALFGLVVGYPDPDRPAAIKPRLPQQAVAFRERYEWTPEQHFAVRAYNGHLRRFQQDQGMAEIDWSTLALRRTRGPEALAGRDTLRQTIAAQGFPLL